MIYFINVFSIISSSRLIFNSFLSLSIKLSTKLNTFLAYKFEAETGSLFKYCSLIILIPFLSIILSTSVNAVFPLGLLLDHKLLILIACFQSYCL